MAQRTKHDFQTFKVYVQGNEIEVENLRRNVNAKVLLFRVREVEEKKWLIPVPVVPFTAQIVQFEDSLEFDDLQKGFYAVEMCWVRGAHQLVGYFEVK